MASKPGESRRAQPGDELFEWWADCLIRLQEKNLSANSDQIYIKRFLTKQGRASVRPLFSRLQTELDLLPAVRVVQSLMDCLSSFGQEQDLRGKKADLESTRKDIIKAASNLLTALDRLERLEAQSNIHDDSELSSLFGLIEQAAINNKWKIHAPNHWTGNRYSYLDRPELKGKIDRILGQYGSHYFPSPTQFIGEIKAQAEGLEFYHSKVIAAATRSHKSKAAENRKTSIHDIVRSIDERLKQDAQHDYEIPKNLEIRNKELAAFFSTVLEDPEINERQIYGIRYRDRPKNPKNQ
jgi:hypothetical protein